MSRSCPLCRFERAYSETTTLCGLDDFLSLPLLMNSKSQLQVTMSCSKTDDTFQTKSLVIYCIHLSSIHVLPFGSPSALYTIFAIVHF